ncbi:MAG TPA: penicillin acylase family protein [Pirellulales bacterium]|jgi:penicillin amidase|nr:penicillin acylase family protein [Pirellulales bacterium]
MRPLPLRHARRNLSAARDEYGVPHIRAASWSDALYGLGYLHGLDRPTQMLFARAIADGRSAELIRDRAELAETDRFFRRAGLFSRVEEESRALDPTVLADVAAYCEGVNDGMRDSGRSLPMWATGFRPSPWVEQSVLLIGNLLSFGGLAVGQQQNERLILELIQAGVDDAQLRELFSPLLDDADFELLRRVKISSQLSDEALELITDLPRLAGSNAWAVAPSRSASGSALLASDPHLEINRLPAIWYEAVLRWDDHYVLGATLPGCPLFAVARTEWLAWGVTYMKGDTSDYFIEDCRPGGATGWQYRRGEQWLDFALREETILHKGGVAESLRIHSNPQGTLDVDPEPTGPGLYLSTAWTGNEPGAGRSMATWVKIIGCRDAASAMDLARECAQPTLCWVFADRDGHIGMQGCGWFPKRGEGNSGLLPVPAWDERNHWKGRLPASLLPRIYDPPEGFVATANENVNPPGGPEFITLPVPAHRKRRIVERLSQLPKATLTDMQSLQYDVISVQARRLLEIFLPHLNGTAVTSRLANWDCSYHAGSLEATLFARLYRNVLLEIFGAAPNRKGGGIGWRRMLYLSSRAGFSTMVITLIDRLLDRETSLWWSDRDKGDLIRRAAERLTGEADQPWGEVNAFRFANRFFPPERVGRVLGFHSRQMPMPGCHATPFQGHLLTTAKRETSFAPSYHFVTDLGTDEAWTNLPGGPSESRFSQFYKNDIIRWQSGVYKRLAGTTNDE